MYSAIPFRKGDYLQIIGLHLHTPTRTLLREHKAELLAALDPAVENLRQRVLESLAVNPALRVAVICDGEDNPVPVALAIRDRGTCEVLIPADKCDPFGLLELMDRQGRTLH